MEFLLKKLKEPTTWIGLIGTVTTFFTLSWSSDAITNLGTGLAYVASALFIIYNEKK